MRLRLALAPVASFRSKADCSSRESCPAPPLRFIDSSLRIAVLSRQRFGSAIATGPSAGCLCFPAWNLFGPRHGAGSH